MRNLSMNIIRWCNENNGFLTAILSLIGLVLSVTAIVVSIRTARLPYKKKLMLGSYMSVGASMIPGVGAETQILGMSASATNVGNRTINITYLGYAIKKDGRYNMIYGKQDRRNDRKEIILERLKTYSEFPYTLTYNNKSLSFSKNIFGRSRPILFGLPK